MSAESSSDAVSARPWKADASELGLFGGFRSMFVWCVVSATGVAFGAHFQRDLAAFCALSRRCSVVMRLAVVSPPFLPLASFAWRSTLLTALLNICAAWLRVIVSPQCGHVFLGFFGMLRAYLALFRLSMPLIGTRFASDLSILAYAKCVVCRRILWRYPPKPAPMLILILGTVLAVYIGVPKEAPGRIAPSAATVSGRTHGTHGNGSEGARRDQARRDILMRPGVERLPQGHGTGGYRRICAILSDIRSDS